MSDNQNLSGSLDPANHQRERSAQYIVMVKSNYGANVPIFVNATSIETATVSALAQAVRLIEPFMSGSYSPQGREKWLRELLSVQQVIKLN